MATEERFEIACADGVRLRAEAVGPSTPKAVVVLAHGVHEHRGRYRHVIAALSERGYAVVAVDHRGHGESGGKRVSCRRFDDYVDDFHLAVGAARQRWTGSPVFVLGHSMGGLIAVRYALRHQAELAGLIVTGPALVIGENVSPWLRRVLTLLSRIAPDWALLPRRPGVLSRDPAVEASAAADPLSYVGRMRLGLAREIVAAAADARGRCGELRLTILAMHGAADELTSPKGSELLIAQAASADKTLRLWPDDRHELFNEFDREAVLACLGEWLDARA